jgi:MFS family permease
VCSFQLIYGKLYSFLDSKYTFIYAIVVFEIGSTICGAAPNSIAFIFGRTVAGFGAAGIISGAFVILMYMVPLHKQPVYQGIMGGVFGVASALGPVLGGAFTQRLSWYVCVQVQITGIDLTRILRRWCFYINLPIGAVAIMIVVFLLDTNSRQVERNLTASERIKKLDPIGSAFLIPGVIFILTALNWGSGEYGWDSARVIAFLVIGSVQFVGFGFVESRMGESALIPPRVLTQRSVASALLFSFGIGGCMTVTITYLVSYS